MSGSNLLRVKNLSKTFPGVKALSGMAFDVHYGEVHALVGENGAGKSTLIKVLTGVEMPDPGSYIEVEGEQVFFHHALDAVRRGIAVVFQDFSLFPNLTVAENIAIGKEIEKEAKILHYKRMHELAKTVLNEMNICSIPLDTKLETLSIAKQQLVAIARGIASNAKIIIMDEPTSALSSNEVKSLFSIINDLKAKGISTLFISHKLDEVMRIADRITVIRDGIHVCTKNKDEFTSESLISAMVGRNIADERFEEVPRGDVLLELKNLSKDKNYANISFQLHAGEVLGITGLVGAGRTEVCKSIFGLNKPDSGYVLIGGEKKKIRSPGVAIKNGLAYVPESRQTEGLIMSKSLKENLCIASLKRISNKVGMIQKRSMLSLAEGYISRLRIQPPYANMAAQQFSGGNQQRIVFGKWLATNPKILIIDEPTNGVDIGAKDEMHRIIKDIAKEGIGVIMVSSDLPEVLKLSDRILVMRGGRIVAEMNPKTATQEQVMEKCLAVSI